MKNNEIIYNAVTTTFTAEQLAKLVSAIYTPEQIAAHVDRAIVVEGVDTYAATVATLAADNFHTFAEWKNQGYSVKKGEHATITCMLWRFTDKPGRAAREAAAAADTDAPENDPHFYPAKSHLFFRSQVEKR